MIFVSKREIRLWVIACLCVLTIYSTLTIARDWLLLIESFGWGLILFVLVSTSVLVFVVTQGLRSLPKVKEILVSIVTVVIYWLVISEIDHPEERVHVIIYGIVAFVIHAALIERSIHGKKIPLINLVVIGAVAVIGTIDEIIQIGLSDRVFDIHDIWYDVLAAVLAVTFNSSLRWARRPST
ncbi:MAG: VanZ family protein [Bacteroidetes bacterium]|nr:VanZ family protein [Bacteroidota bacterium]